MPGAPRRPPTPATLYLGTVSKVTGTTATVVIPELGGPGYSYGPARFPDHLAAGAATSSVDADAGGTDPAHTHHPGRPLAAGDPVLVGLLATRTGTRDAVVILSRLA